MKIKNYLNAVLILLLFTITSCGNSSNEAEDCIMVINKHRKALGLKEIAKSSLLQKINKEHVSLFKAKSLAFGVSEANAADENYSVFARKYLFSDDYNISVNYWTDEKLKEGEDVNATMNDLLIESNLASKIDEYITEYLSETNSSKNSEENNNFLDPKLISYDVSRANELLNVPKGGKLTIHSNGGIPTLTSYISTAFLFSDD